MPEAVKAPGYAISGPSAFLKIADGCSRRCAFCAIPHIKGPYVSRTREAILDDARALQDQGVLEINLIAQDTTFYGRDRGETDGLATLLEQLVEAAPEVPWIRVLYAFPGQITPHLIEVMAHSPQILPYIDLPLQHAHPAVLRRMQRPADVDQVRHTIRRLREAIPALCLRTTFITGFPGETETEFTALLDFVKELRFDRIGVFTYSHEAETPAAALPDDVPEAVKEKRREALMLTQQRISLEKNSSLVGQKLKVLVESVEEGLTIGRSYRDAPEIDGLVLIEGEASPGEIIQVEITEGLVYDLKGRIGGTDPTPPGNSPSEESPL